MTTQFNRYDESLLYDITDDRIIHIIDTSSGYASETQGEWVLSIYNFDDYDQRQTVWIEFVAVIGISLAGKSPFTTEGICSYYDNVFIVFIVTVICLYIYYERDLPLIAPNSVLLWSTGASFKVGENIEHPRELSDDHSLKCRTSRNASTAGIYFPVAMYTLQPTICLQFNYL